MEPLLQVTSDMTEIELTHGERLRQEPATGRFPQIGQAGRQAGRHQPTTSRAHRTMWKSPANSTMTGSRKKRRQEGKQRERESHALLSRQTDSTRPSWQLDPSPLSHLNSTGRLQRQSQPTSESMRGGCGCAPLVDGRKDFSAACRLGGFQAPGQESSRNRTPKVDVNKWNGT